MSKQKKPEKKSKRVEEEEEEEDNHGHSHSHGGHGHSHGGHGSHGHSHGDNTKGKRQAAISAQQKQKQKQEEHDEEEDDEEDEDYNPDEAIEGDEDGEEEEGEEGELPENLDEEEDDDEDDGGFIGGYDDQDGDGLGQGERGPRPSLDTVQLLTLLTTSNSDSLINKKGEKVPVSSLSGKVVALYVSANKDSESKAFTATLNGIYEEIKESIEKKEAEVGFELVYVSADNSDNDFKKIFGNFPDGVLAIPRKDNRIMTCMETFQVRSLPQLVLFDSQGKVQSLQGRGILEEEGAEGFPWKREEGRVRQLSVNLGHEWQTKPSVILLAEDCLDEKKIAKLRSDLNTVADKHRDILFFHCFQNRLSAEGIREMMKLTAKPALVLLDMENEIGRYVFAETNDEKINESSILKFVDDFKNKTLKPFFISATRPPNDKDPNKPDSPLLLLVSDSFDELVMDESKAVLVALHAPWASPCRIVEEHMITAHKILFEKKEEKKNEKKEKKKAFTMCKINCDENELDPRFFPEQEVPLLKLFLPGQKKTPLSFPFENGFNAVNILEFIHQNASDYVKFDLVEVKKRLKTTRQNQYNELIPEYEKIYNQIVVFGEQKLGLKHVSHVIQQFDVPKNRLINLKSDLKDNGMKGPLTSGQWVKIWETVIDREDFDPTRLLAAIKQVLAVPLMGELGVCSYVATGKTAVQQDFFNCKTCSKKGETGCCYACATTCHKGHKLYESPYGDVECFCDCGAGTLGITCKSMKKRAKGAKIEPPVTENLDEDDEEEEDEEEDELQAGEGEEGEGDGDDQEEEQQDEEDEEEEEQTERVTQKLSKVNVSDTKKSSKKKQKEEEEEEEEEAKPVKKTESKEKEKAKAKAKARAKMNMQQEDEDEEEEEEAEEEEEKPKKTKTPEKGKGKGKK